MEALNKYWALIQSHWVVLAAIVIAIAFAGMIVWFQMSSRSNGYDFLDTLKGSDGKASQDAVIVYAMATLAGWYIVVKTLYPAAGNAGGDLVNILMIFLVYRLGKRGVEAYEKKPTQPPAPSGDNIAQQVVVPGIEPVAEVKPAGAIKTLKA